MTDTKHKPDCAVNELSYGVNPCTCGASTAKPTDAEVREARKCANCAWFSTQGWKTKHCGDCRQHHTGTNNLPGWEKR